MTDSTRQQLLQVLAELSELCPEMRMGQLIANLASLVKGAAAEAVWDVEDDELLTAARKQLLYFQERRRASVA
jgi:hypothetical protein